MNDFPARISLLGYTQTDAVEVRSGLDLRGAVPFASNKQPAGCESHTFVVRVGPEHLSIYHAHLFAASGGRETKRRFHLIISHGTVHLNPPACLLNCGQIALAIQCFTLRSNNRTRVPDRVPRIGRSSSGCKLLYKRLPCSCLTFFFFYLPPDGQLYSATPLACRSIHTHASARANWSSLLFFSLLGASSSLRRRRPLKLPFRD